MHKFAVVAVAGVRGRSEKHKPMMNLWGPVMFDEKWNLLTGQGEMGGFARDWLEKAKDLDQPQR